MVFLVEEAFRILKRQNQNRLSPHYIVVKPLIIQNKERSLNNATEKSHIKANL
jgi:hypothetical protein